MRTPHEIQMANLALQLLGRATIQMNELEAATAVRDWLVGIAREQVPQMQPVLNGVEHPQPNGNA